MFRMFESLVPAGALSIVPPLCFTLWFFFTARQKLIHIIPPRVRNPAKYILISCTPLVTISDAIGAFVGVSYRKHEALCFRGLTVTFHMQVQLMV